MGLKYPPVIVNPTPRVKGQRVSQIDDPAFRTRAVSIASTGISRAGAAAVLGIGQTTLYEWLCRGEAEPGREPWGSFSEAYRRAERGIDLAVASATARRCHAILMAQEAVAQWWEAGAVGDPPPAPSSGDFEWMLRLQQARFPADYGISAHRKPEQEPDGAAWIERTAMTHDQLCALVSDPPEALRKALAASADKVYDVLRAEGWRPKEVGKGKT